MVLENTVFTFQVGINIFVAKGEIVADGRGPHIHWNSSPFFFLPFESGLTHDFFSH